MERSVKVKDLMNDEQDDYKYILYRESTLNNFFIPKCLDVKYADEIEKARIQFSIETEQLKIKLLEKISKRLNVDNISLIGD